MHEDALTSDEVAAATWREQCRRPPLMLRMWIGQDCYEEYGQPLRDLVESIPEDFVQVGYRQPAGWEHSEDLPDYRWAIFDKPQDEDSKAIDARRFLPAWDDLDEFLETMPDPYGVIIGLVFLVSTGLVIVNFVSWFISWFQTQRRIRKRKESIRTEVNRLDDAERAVLREFFRGKQSTIPLPLDHPVVAGLIARGIIIQVGRFGWRSAEGMMFSFRVSEAASEFITPRVLGLEKHLIDESDGNWTLNEEGIQWISENRPRFV